MFRNERETLKARPQKKSLIVTSNPYVAFTPFGYQPFLNVKTINDELFKINISPRSLANELNKLFEENNNKWIDLKFNFAKESSDPKSKYLINKVD